MTADSHATVSRPRVDGKFFRVGKEKFYVKGVTYGPFAPNPEGEMFPDRTQARLDFSQLRHLRANLLRVYYVPPRWFLDLAEEQGFKVLIDIPWPKHLCFLDSISLKQQAVEAVRNAVTLCKAHPAVFAYSVVNEVPAEIVRWSGPAAIEKFIDHLVGVAKQIDPECLCTFANFPPTEFLNPEGVDFVSFNIYLHETGALERYLARLQMLADTKPLLLTELGMDSLREGEPRKSQALSEQLEVTFRAGLAGAVVFSYTDDWFRGGMQIEDWAFGLTTRHRKPKDSFGAVQRVFATAPRIPLRVYPKVSVVVASYNGARTLEACLESLGHLNYPDYEVILVDDGSTDNTQRIAAKFPAVRNIRQKNLGLSAARNCGIAAAWGEIVAFTDSDCRADEDWLYYMVSDLLRTNYVGMGGHNLLPPDDSPVAAVVMASPGGPAHVMLTDTEAEHIPGCNMAFYKSALDQIGGFDPVFRKAGDDVDVCWRLQQQGYKIGFSSAGFVWHYRRSTVRAYLNQQNGYGEAEALLLRKHPQYFNSAGRSRWAGRIYATSRVGLILERSIIYHGLFGSALFQHLYTPNPSHVWMLCTSPEYHLLISVPLLLLSLVLPWLWPLALTSFLLSAAVCVITAGQAHLPKAKRRFFSRPLVALLFFLQPLERGLAKYRCQLRSRPSPVLRPRESQTSSPETFEAETLVYWSDGSTDRMAFLRSLLGRFERERWQVRSDSGWTNYDIEVLESPWARMRLTTATEVLDQGRLSLRCRLNPQWALAAKALFCGVLGIELIIAIILGPIFAWSWMLLLTLPLVGWFFEYHERKLQRQVAMFLDALADENKWIKLHSARRSMKPSSKESPRTGAAHPVPIPTGSQPAQTGAD
jgi:GT2 family glycosyltransferase